MAVLTGVYCLQRDGGGVCWQTARIVTLYCVLGRCYKNPRGPLRKDIAPRQLQDATNERNPGRTRVWHVRGWIQEGRD